MVTHGFCGAYDVYPQFPIIILTCTSAGFLYVVVDTFTLRLLAAPDSIPRTRHLQTGAKWYCILHTLGCDLGNRPLPLGSGCGGVAYEAHCLLFTHRAPYIGENAVTVGSHFSKKGKDSQEGLTKIDVASLFGSSLL
jgi:hypothetical protein